ncbi:hypothetical protein ABK040_006329 [Willaertia magna]
MDKITQLQDQLSLITNIMVDSIGVLQRDAPPVQTDFQIQNNLPLVSDISQLPNKLTLEKLREQAKEAGENLVKACVDFENMLDELPGLINTQENQIQALNECHENNEKQTQILKDRLELAEDYLNIVSKSLEEIANDRLRVRHTSTKH